MKHRKPLFALLRQLAFAGLSRQDYESARPYMYAKDYNLLTYIATIGSVIMLGLMLAAMFVREIRVFFTAYAALFAVLVVILILNKTLASANHFLAIPFFYITMTGVYAFGIALGTALQPDMPATTFPVMLFALPLLLIDKPYRCSIMLLLATVAFCVCSRIFKPGNIFKLDLINNISFCFLSILCNQVVMSIKLNDLTKRCYIERQRDTDGLTQLLNRSAGEAKILKFLEHDSAPSTLLMLDIDRFKSINDTCGHYVGDMALQHFGKGIKDTFRSTDILIRYGGDEFLMFLPGISHRELINQKSDELIERITAQVQDLDFMPKMDFSAGAAFYPEDGSAYEDLLKKADDALYYSKFAECRLSFYSECYGGKRPD